MTTPQMLLFVSISAVAMSYGWGMRGTTIGGEKGAMLPGAIMGLLIAVFSGSPLLRENFYMLSAVGSMGMYFGGCMTYGETLGLSMNTRPAENMKKGLIALFVKGFLWFGLFGSFMGIYLSASTGRVYSKSDFYLMFALLPLFAIMGYFLFNKPLDAKKAIFPKIYFSKTRQESWGGLLGILVLLVIFASMRRDFFALKLMLGSAFSGAFGWVIAQCLQIFAKYPMKNGKYFFKTFQEKKMLDAWKIMECTIGLLTGIGICVTICLLRDDLGKINMMLANRGGLWNPLESAARPLMIAWLALIALDMLQFVIKEPLSKTELDNLLRKTLISKQEYDREMLKADKEKPGKFFKIYRALVEGFEFPIYSVIPLALVLLGNKEVAKLSSFFIVYLVIVQETCFEKFNYFKSRHLIRIVTLGGGIALLAAQFAFNWAPNAMLTMLMYGIFYELLTLMYVLHRPKTERFTNKKNLTEAYGSSIPTHTYFAVCIALMSIFAAIYL